MKIPNPFKRSKPRKKKSAEVSAVLEYKTSPKIEKEDHQHSWELVAKTYASPIGKNNSAIETAVSERAQFGVTSLLFQCSLCKTFNKEEMLGSDIDTLDDMLEKAESYGPQVVQKSSGETYVIQKWQNPAQAGQIPVR